MSLPCILVSRKMHCFPVSMTFSKQNRHGSKTAKMIQLVEGDTASSLPLALTPFWVWFAFCEHCRAKCTILERSVGRWRGHGLISRSHLLWPVVWLTCNCVFKNTWKKAPSFRIKLPSWLPWDLHHLPCDHEHTTVFLCICGLYILKHWRNLHEEKSFIKTNGSKLNHYLV